MNKAEREYVSKLLRQAAFARDWEAAVDAIVRALCLIVESLPVTEEPDAGGKGEVGT